MRLLPSDPQYLHVHLLMDRYCRLVNIHMHPWDEDAVLPAPEREVLRQRLHEDLRVLIED